MFKNIKFQIILALVFSMLFWSCSEDLGNYDYVDINQVEFEGIASNYTALFGEPFEIIPTLNYTKDGSADESRYSYEWVAYNETALQADQKWPLATTKNLQLEALTVPPNDYNVRYLVTDVETGVQWSTSFKLNVESTISEGWMVLNDVNGVARLDMVSKVAGEYSPIYDVLDYANSSLTLEGAPVNVYCYAYDPQFYGIYVTTEGTGTTKIEPDTFDWKVEYYLSFEMLSDVPTDFGADFIERTGGNESVMYKDGNFYYYVRVYQYRYGVPINIVDGEVEPFKAAPFVGAVGQFRGANLYYDVEERRFLRQSWGAQKCNVMPEGTLFDYNTGKDLLFMDGTSYNGGEVFAILKEPGLEKLFLARMSSGIFGRINQVYYEEIPAEIAADMAQADHFAVSPQFGYVFYNVGGKIYEYDFGLKQTKLMIDRGDEEVTVLKFQKLSPYSNSLLLATHGAGASSGKMSLYEVAPVNGDLVPLESYDGFGKIVSISYRDQ
ncbi:PKD-like family lipoprotein [Aestuariibaculum sp. YM273]|uniref:PKD-like family lipoprotein n=1 Tax=Aestuariibaculum sp. YM273 TaxID=3070659 RepID=UPI0027DE6094|nr:PKD-like family lipoprotein [Aestuariibaculum sp. YM273]WMI64129.1 PKD-like family lipoprotein [Aestuariibaculum sp. YM273]